MKTVLFCTRPQRNTSTSGLIHPVKGAAVAFPQPVFFSYPKISVILLLVYTNLDLLPQEI
jgi:hypothetical protein